MNLQPSWNPTRVKQLERLVAAGLSAGNIGKAMGVSRNSIIGKLRRLNVPLAGARNGHDIEVAATTKKRNRYKRIASTKSLAAAEKRKQINQAMDAMKDLPPDQSPFACTIHELGSVAQMDRCRFVLDEPNAKALYCGAASEGPWCPRHHDLVFARKIV